MPYAARRKHEELNRAYAHVAGARFGVTAGKLQDALVHMGFEPNETQTAIETAMGDLPLAPFRTPFVQRLTAEPALGTLSDVERAQVQVVADEDGFKLVAKGVMPDALVQEVHRLAPEEEKAAANRSMEEHNRDWQPSPSEQGCLLVVPRLVVDVDGVRSLFDTEEIELPWEFDLLKYPADLSSFRYDEVTRSYSLDYEGRHVVIKPLQTDQIEFLPVNETLPGLVGWLDRKLRQTSVNQTTLTAWIYKALTDAKDAGNSLEVLFRGKFLLLRKFAERFADAQQEDAKQGYQRLLETALVEMDDEFGFVFSSKYEAHWYTPGTYRFDKHFYPRPGELEEKGEEFECAVEIDRLEEVRYWVRNLAGPGRERELRSFWLQTADGRFYPDFVASLKDGRTLIVEYKGREDDKDRRKEELGHIWANRSGQRAVFLMARKRDERGRNLAEQLKAAISGVQNSFVVR